MMIRVNGKDLEVARGATLLSIVEKGQMKPERIVVDYNKEIIPKDKLGEIVVAEKDLIEILSFVGGG